MSHRYSSSTNASRVAEGISSRGFAVKPTPPPPIAETAETQSPRTFLSSFSIHSGKTGRIGRRLSSRTSEPSTFYREATPPGSSQGEPVARPEETYDGRYDHVAPPAPIPVAPTRFGMSRRRFCILLWAVIVVIAVIAVAVPVGVVFGMRSSRHDTTADTKSASVTRYGSPLCKTSHVSLKQFLTCCAVPPRRHYPPPAPLRPRRRRPVPRPRV